VKGLNFELGESIALLRETVYQFAKDEIAPIADEVDREGHFPRAIWRKPRTDVRQVRIKSVAWLRNLGLLALSMPMVPPESAVRHKSPQAHRARTAPFPACVLTSA